MCEGPRFYYYHSCGLWQQAAAAVGRGTQRVGPAGLRQGSLSPGRNIKGEGGIGYFINNNKHSFSHK